MVILGHQFRGNLESDWMLKTSVRYDTGGSTEKILQKIFKENKTEKEKKLNSKEYKLSSPSNPSSHSNNFKEIDHVEQYENVYSSRKKNNGGYIFENFDESQHLNGCPLKWLYHKQISERNATYLLRRTSSRESYKREKFRQQNNAKLRDKTPAEVKINKINLTERSDISNGKQNFIEEPDVRREIEIHRRNLAAKLNWKLHDDTPGDSEWEIPPKLRYNYLHPRPLRGLKPLLSILLLPHQKTKCCPTKIQIQPNSVTKKVIKSPTLSIKSLELPQVKIKKNSSNQIKALGRWGSKSHRLEKKLQIPNQITINLREKQFGVKPKKENKNKVSASNVSNASLKKSSDKVKQGKESKSLSSLFYQLSNKINYKNEENEYFEDLLRDLTLEDEEVKFQRFFKYNVTGKSGIRHKEKSTNEKKNISTAKGK